MRQLVVWKLQTLLLPVFWDPLALIGVMYRSVHNVSHIILKTVLKNEDSLIWWHVRCRVLWLHFYKHRSALQAEVFRIIPAFRTVLFEDICSFEHSFLFYEPAFACLLQDLLAVTHCQ